MDKSIKTTQFFQIKINIYKLRQQFNPSLILRNIHTIKDGRHYKSSIYKIHQN